MEGAIERAVYGPHPQGSVQHDQRFADSLDDALGVDLGHVGGFLGLFQGGHVDKRDDHAVPERGQALIVLAFAWPFDSPK